MKLQEIDRQTEEASRPLNPVEKVLMAPALGLVTIGIVMGVWETVDGLIGLAHQI